MVFSPDAEHCIQCAAQEYPNDERTHCLPKPVTYLDFKDALGLSMACTALWFSVVTAVVFGVFVKHRDTPIVKANNQTFSFILLISLLLCFLCSLLLIHYPNTVTCIFQQVTFGLVFTVAVSLFRQNHYCDSGIQGHEAWKNNEVPAAIKGF